MLDPAFITLVWIPVAALLFGLLKPVRALTLAYVVGWLCLSPIPVEARGIWDLDKILATNLGVTIGLVVFCGRFIRPFRFGWPDLLIVGYFLASIGASLTNGLGLYDGCSRASYLFFLYGTPYFAGRLLLRSRADLQQAAVVIVRAACVYAMLAVWEWRMSPRLHEFVYGFFAHSWDQHYRWGFWRPILFFLHAIALGTFFAWTSLLSLWMWWNGQLPPWGRVPAWVVALGPLVGLMTSMSLGPWGLFACGLGGLLAWQLLRCKWVALVPVCCAFGWMLVRYNSVDDGQWLLSAVREVSPERAASLRYRLDAETVLIARAKIQPMLGWGTWGRNHALNAEGLPVAIDGLWVILVGTAGLIGLGCFYLWWCWPVFSLPWTSRSLLSDGLYQALLLSVGLISIHLLFNGFLDPMLILLHGCAINLRRLDIRTQRMLHPAPSRRLADAPVGLQVTAGG